ncbi:ROK family protein [Pontiella sulfatireligans]|uniref:Fructokinase n=1 Tax=Pontiella sulfatireligans TaxID=2750658 RepID=A0A6C2UHA5_9BACT|nr:ROK family protein [Pontiella sulfatireligans]VGO19575.1 Fructokinase [Pontiella sulfatireligans]
MDDNVKNPVCLGVDIGGTKTKIAYFDQGELTEVAHFPTSQDPRKQLDLLVSYIEKAELPGTLHGIGIGCPGPLDPQNGIILSPPNLPRWENFHLRDELAERIGVHVRVENDANVGALGEAMHGTGRDFRNVFYMTISTGTGTGIVIDRKIYNSTVGTAGEIWAFDPALFQGKQGERNLTDLTSGTGMVDEAVRRIQAGCETSLKAEGLSTPDLERAAGSDPLADALREDALTHLSATLVFVLTLLAPDIIVLGGGLCADPEWLVDPLVERVRRQLPLDCLKNIPIQRAELWNSAVLYGAVEMRPCGRDECLKNCMKEEK